MSVFDRAKSEKIKLEEKWRPIESAPKDGTHVLLFWNDEVLTGHWWPRGKVQYGAKGNWTKDRFGLGSTAHWSAPTHWQPLPKPPAEEST